MTEPAFPGPSDPGCWEGISIRDYFAAAALSNPYTTDGTDRPGAVAEWAYQVADAMLKERDK
jgi:hypothetical protein